MLMPIEIDFEIHRAIENERRDFGEPPYMALRRLLKLEEKSPTKPDQPAVASVGRPWRSHGVELPHGTEARMSYLRGAQQFSGHFLDGYLVVEGRKFSTPSEAISALAKTGSGNRTQLNGWNYWEVKLPDQKEWISIKALRARARKARQGS
jgi:hypothetical protein